MQTLVDSTSVSPVQSIGRTTRPSTDRVVLSLLTLFVGMVCFGQAITKPFWYDELITIRIARLATYADIFRFHESGLDTTSFLPAMLVHLFNRLHGLPELTLRLPFMLAYVVTCVCVWMFARRRYSLGFAVSALLLLLQGTSFYFACESRAYAFTMMGTGIAMVCWQRAGAGKRSSGLAALGTFLGLSIAIAFHFFAIFLFVPFAAAEWAHQRVTGRIRAGMWAALFLFPAAVGIMLPGMITAKHTYGATFWSKPTMTDLTTCYVGLLEPVARDFATILLVVAMLLWFGRRRDGELAGQSVAEHLRTRVTGFAGENTGFTQAEWVLLAGFTLVPLIAFIGSQMLGVYQVRYVIYFQLGAVLLIVGLMAEFLHRRTRAGVVLAVAMLLLAAIHARTFLGMGIRELAGKPIVSTPTEYKEVWYNVIRNSSLPVVTDGSITFLPLQYYAPPDLKRRLVLLTSGQHSGEQPASVTTDLNMRVFGARLNYPVQDYDHFVSTHHDFYLVSGTEWLKYGWVSRYLLHESASGHNVRVTLLWENPLEPTNQVAIYKVHLGLDEPGQAEAF